MSFFGSFLQNMNCSSVLGFSSSHVKKKKKSQPKILIVTYETSKIGAVGIM